MNQIEKDIMLGLISILNEANDAYYNSGNPIMTDEQFDMRLEDLRQLEEDVGFVFANSPTQNVGYKVLTELKETEHKYPMLSLDKCHSIEELLKFIDNKDTIASIKLDGCSVALTYENGILIKAESRGNGHIGNDITEHIKRFKNVPLKINKENTYLIYGEAIINDEDFAEINKDGEFKNSRNLTSGTLSVLDTSLVAKRKLRFVAWDIIEGGSNSFKDNLNEAKELGFDIVPFWFVPNSTNALNPKNLQSNIDYVFDCAEEEGYPCDGVVFKFDDIEYGKSLGATSHHFRNGIAYKRKDDTYKTKLLDVEYTMGKTGVLTPTAVFEPVEIDGTIVERASVHNISILTKLDLHVGDIIEVYKANQIIPQIKRNISADERDALGKEPYYIIIPPYCPVCGGTTIIKQDNNSQILVCLNDNCKGKLLGKLTHFVSKNAINIDGISEQTLEKFIELGWLNSFKDIFTLKDHFTETVKLDGFGEKSVKNLLNSIEKSKTTTLDRFIYSLSIPLIGKSASKTIAKYCEYDIMKFLNSYTADVDWTVLNDFGNNMSDSLKNYIAQNSKEIIDLCECFTFVKPTNNESKFSENKFSNKVFCITGSLEHFANRDKLKEKIESLGGKVSGSVSAKTDYLICNEESSSSKYKKAKELNTTILTEEEFIKMIK